MQDLIEALVEAIGPDAVLAGDAVDESYGIDETLKAVAVQPVAVARPATTQDVARIVDLARERGVAVTARGAGTGLSGACIPRADGLVVSFERMDAIVELDDAGHTAVVQPGVTLAQLDEATAALGLVYPVFPGTLAAPWAATWPPTPGACAP